MNLVFLGDQCVPASVTDALRVAGYRVVLLREVLPIRALWENQWHAGVGYIYAENVVPDETFTPSVPDSARHAFSTGLGYAGERWSFDLGLRVFASADADDFAGDGGGWHIQAGYARAFAKCGGALLRGGAVG